MNTEVDITFNIKGSLSQASTKWLLSDDSIVSNEIKAKLMRDELCSSHNTSAVYEMFATRPLVVEVLARHNDSVLASALLEKRLVRRIYNDFSPQAKKDTKTADALISLLKCCLDESMEDEISFGQLRAEGIIIEAEVIDNAGPSVAALFSHELFETDDKMLGNAFQGRRKAYMLGRASSEQKASKPTPTTSAQALIDCPDIITQAINAITEGVAEEEKAYVI